jgi:signal recognition particle receptor subunit beta
MPHLNYSTRELAFKVVYYGPGMSGKTTNIMYVHRNLGAARRSEIVSLDTSEERTLFFDFFAMELGRIEGYGLRFNLYTVPGQAHYEASRRLIMDGADGVVFVADSQPARLEENLVSLRSLQEFLRARHGEGPGFPLVLQYNKRDCASPIPLGTLEPELRADGVPVVEAVATHGVGIMETVRLVSRRIIERFQV